MLPHFIGDKHMKEFKLVTKPELLDVLLTKKELADLLRISVATITNQMGEKKEGITIPYAIKLGGRYRWKKETVMQWLFEKEQERRILVERGFPYDVPKVCINRNLKCT
jgi:predicted DNA-binding transcriptional regulator AlpA